MTTDRLLLNDLLHLTEDELMRTKIRFCIQPSQETYNPIEIFKSNPDAINSGWLFDRKKKNIFQIGETAICLVRLSNDPDLWLLTTVKTITKDTGRYGGGIGWEGEEWSQYKPYYGRTIIRHHKGQETLSRPCPPMVLRQWRYYNSFPTCMKIIRSQVTTTSASPGVRCSE